jgi:hypothetical protein
VIHYKKLNKNVLNYNDKSINEMKDSGWVYIKDTMLLPIRFVVEISFIPFSKSNKTKRKYKNSIP